MRKKITIEVCLDCFKLLNFGDSAEFESGFDKETAKENLREFGDFTFSQEKEAFFSWQKCDICESRLGGDRFEVVLKEF